MKKIKLLGISIIIIGLFLAQGHKLLHAFSFETVCQSPLTTFSDGNSTFDVSFPPGGGTTCDTIADCPKISLPANGTVFSVKVDMELTNPASEIGTPYIWIPNSDSDSLAQIRTSDGTLVKLFTNGDSTIGDSAICGLTASFDNPSRITVMPGGDVWVGNRGNSTVTRLSPKEGTIAGGTCGNGVCNVGENNGSCSQDCEEYEVNCNYGVGSGPRGITYDINGKIWVGGTGDSNMYKFNSDGTVVSGPMAIEATKSYGMIGDAFGYVWISDRSSIPDKVVKIDSTTNTFISSTAFSNGAAYGIGIDNEGDIWLGNYLGAEEAVHQIDGTSGVDTTPAGLPNVTICGVAVDQNNIVWAAACGISPGLVYAFRQDGTQLAGSPFTSGGTHTRGIAIDFDGNVWAVNRNVGGAGSVTKMDSAGSVIDTYPTGGNNPYNYSDMTGLRTVPKSITVGGASASLSTTGTFEICTDGTTTCTDSTDCMAVTTFLVSTCIKDAAGNCIVPPTCTPDVYGNCEVSLKIFSMQAGDYTLKNLEIIYGKQVPITTGGLVPCGRDWNDPDTPWDDRDSCDMCYGIMLLNQGMNFLLGIAGIVAVLALIITGLLFVTSAGNPERKNNAKQTLKWVLTGFLIVFLSWLLVDFLLSAWGYLDPLGGKWNIVCD